jgi:hypothetical protein
MSDFLSDCYITCLYQRPWFSCPSNNLWRLQFRAPCHYVFLFLFASSVSAQNVLRILYSHDFSLRSPFKHFAIRSFRYSKSLFVLTRGIRPIISFLFLWRNNCEWQEEFALCTGHGWFLINSAVYIIWKFNEGLILKLRNEIIIM